MDIEFTRGDTQIIKFQIKDAKGNILELKGNDTIYFTVKQNSNSPKKVLQKKYPNEITFSNGYFSFVINSVDTSELQYGTYQYDIELKSGQYVKTLAFGEITLTDEITFRRDE